MTSPPSIINYLWFISLSILYFNFNMQFLVALLVTYAMLV